MIHDLAKTYFAHIGLPLPVVAGIARRYDNIDNMRCLWAVYEIDPATSTETLKSTVGSEAEADALMEQHIRRLEGR